MSDLEDHVDGGWRKGGDVSRERALAELQPRQAAILDQAATLIRSGGRLVYATCSLLSEENEDQVDAFLTRHPAFTLVPLVPGPDPGTHALLPDTGQYLALTPARHGTDGFFAAVLERRTGARNET